MSPFSARATTTGTGGGVPGAVVRIDSLRRQTNALASPTTRANASHANQWLEPVVGLDADGFRVESGPAGEFGGAGSLVSAMRRCVSHGQMASCKLCSQQGAPIFNDCNDCGVPPLAGSDRKST